MTAPTLTDRRPADGPTVLGVYDAALRRAAAGKPVMLTLCDDRGGEHRIDAAAWCRPHLPGDAALLAGCAGPTLDVGCGPGRLTGALAQLGHPALGIDVSATAIELALQRGASALLRNVFAPLPGHGRWRHLLLADGNIGIGGDPEALLNRCRALLAPDGRLHAELAPPGTRSWAGSASIRDGSGAASTQFPWAAVAADDIGKLAQAASLRVLRGWSEAGRWFTTLSAA